MKTKKPSKTRSAVVRLSNAISLESFNADLDFLTNKGLLDRYNTQSGNIKDGGNIAQSEIHKSDRKSTRLNSSHANISYAVFCLKKKNTLSQTVNVYHRTH